MKHSKHYVHIPMLPVNRQITPVVLVFNNVNKYCYKETKITFHACHREDFSKQSLMFDKSETGHILT